MEREELEPKLAQKCEARPRVAKPRKLHALSAAPQFTAPPRKPSGLIRTVACLVGTIGLFAWYVDEQRQTAAAAEPQAARLSLQRPASPVDGPAQYLRAVQQIEAGEASEGAASLRSLAESGFVMAQYRLAKAYESGEGVTSDLTLARHWTERAAIGGNRQAMHDLGVYYSRGESVARDDAAAFRWFRQAADFDLADSQLNLGILYEQGRGARADAGEALFWFMLAARHGDEAAAARVSLLQTQLTGMQVEQAHARMQAFQPRMPDALANGAFALPVVAAEPVTAESAAAAPDASGGAPADVETPVEAAQPALQP